MTEKKFSKGFIFKRPRPGAPDFVRGSLSIKVDEATEFLKETANDDGWVNLDLLVSKDGQKLYFTVNEYKPKEKEEPENKINPEDLPAF